MGHWRRVEEVRQVSLTDPGLPMHHEALADYQMREHGGEGFPRLMHFDPENNEIGVETFYPSLDQYERDENSEFVLPGDSENRF